MKRNDAYSRDVEASDKEKQRVLIRYFFFMTTGEQGTFKEQTFLRKCPECSGHGKIMEQDQLGKFQRVLCSVCQGKKKVKQVFFVEELDEAYERIVKEHGL